MEIKIDDLTKPAVVNFLRAHLQSLSAISRPESMHALSIDALRSPKITFWCVWDGIELIGCGALREMDSEQGEVKSMRTAAAHLRKGVASRLLVHIIGEARHRRYRRLSLETGSSRDFEPAQRLYAKFGFSPCAPFGDYVPDPNSLFMTKTL
jgi:putative acetyltransferase